MTNVSLITDYVYKTVLVGINGLLRYFIHIYFNVSVVCSLCIFILGTNKYVCTMNTIYTDVATLNDGCIYSPQVFLSKLKYPKHTLTHTHMYTIVD